MSFAPNLPKEVMDDMPRRMSEYISDCVDAHSGRDANLTEYYEILMRIATPNPNKPFANSCDLVDPITFEQFLGLFATVRAARSQKPWWLFQPIEQQDEDAAQRTEKGLSSRADRDGFGAALYDADWVSLRDGCAPMFIGWSEKRKNIRKVMFRDTEEENLDNLITAEEREPDRDYTEVPVLEPTLERTGLEFSVCDLANFYMMPPDAADIESATSVGERRYLTANQLLAGIEEYEFDKDVIDTLLDLGPTGYGTSGEYQELKNETAGTDVKHDRHKGIGVWEIYHWYGKFPVWLQSTGKQAIPAHLQTDEFLWIICPRHEQVLRFTYSPFLMRPYTEFRMLREPGGQGGESVPSITGPNQEEGTLVLRMGIDAATIRTAPMVKVLEDNDREFGSQKVGPGRAWLCKKSLNEIEPVRWDGSQANETHMWLQDNRSRARETMASMGYGQLQQKVRKNAEVESAVAATSSKMNLFVSNLQDSGMVRAAHIMLSHISQFGGDDAYKVYNRNQGLIEVGAEDWKRTYEITPRGSADDANPAVRLRQKQAVYQAYVQSPIGQRDIAAGDLRGVYHALREFFTANNEPNPQAYLGEEPPAPQYMQMAAQFMAQVYEQMTDRPGSAQQVAPMFMQNPIMQKVFAALIAQQGQGQQGAQQQATQGPAPGGAQMAVGQGHPIAAGRNGHG